LINNHIIKFHLLFNYHALRNENISVNRVDKYEFSYDTVHKLFICIGALKVNKKNLKKASSCIGEPVKDWHPADVKAALHKAGWTMTALAAKHGLKSSNTLSKALTSSYPIAEKRIADALGLHPKTIWPSRYYDNGAVKPRGFHAIQFNRINHVVNGKDDAINNHAKA
jgi:Ner family transcriptional regulator